MILLIYLSRVIICSAIFYAYYFFFLHNKRFHQYNRYYLLISASLSFLFPLLQIPIFNSAHVSDNVLIKTLNVITVGGWEDEFVMPNQRSFLSSLLSFQNIAQLIYVAGVIILVSYALKFLVYLRRLSEIYRQEQLDKVKFYNTAEPGTPFSFFNSLYWNQKIPLTSEKGQHILRHELFHIRSGHSYDIVFIKCITIVFWFNPIYHLFLKEIKAIHEFLADEHASTSMDKYDYAELLVTEAINNKNAFLSNQFFHHQIKRRITMIIKHNHTNFSYARRITALPLLLMLFCAFAFKTGRHYQDHDRSTKSPAEPITVIIDAAHGGVDPGAKSMSGLAEKDIALSIAQKIKDLSTNYGVNVIMTRDKDVLPGNASNAIDGLRNRTSISEKSNAEMFVSIHLSATDAGSTLEAANGFDIYVSSQNKQFGKSKLLASAISGEIRKTYKIADVLKESNSVWVLKKIPIPSILIECGFITDKADLDFITNQQNQEKIANDILRGIVNYHNSTASAHYSDQQQKSDADTMPLSEAVRFIKSLIEKGEPLTLTSDSKKDIIIWKLPNGDSIVMRQSEFMKLYGKDGKQQSPGSNAVFTQTETEPSYPGGGQGWVTYLNKNFQYPKDAINNSITGTVMIQFMVDEVGKVTDIEAINGPTTGGLKEESIRLIQNSGPWIPAKQNGLAVKSLKKQPFTFKLEEQ